MEKLNEEQMEWLGLKILSQVANGSIIIPKNYFNLTINDECVIDIGFAIAHTYTDQQIVQFFKQLDDHSQPFSTKEEYSDYMHEGFERQEDELCKIENISGNSSF